MDNAVHVEQISDTLRIKLYQDTDCESPREWSNMGTMVLAHGRYDLPREGDLAGRIDEAFERGGLRLALRYLAVVHDAVVLPVYGYDHGGLSLSVGSAYPFTDPWDSGVAGVIYSKRITAVEWFGEETQDETFSRILTEEVSTYNQYLEGDIYGYVVEELCQEHSVGQTTCDFGEWVERESCWGYYGQDDALSQARHSIGMVSS